jgi:UDP-2,3-diacylglucosamine hydrolase
LGEGLVYANLGDWMGYNTYAVFDGKQFSIETFEKQD